MKLRLIFAFSLFVVALLSCEGIRRESAAARRDRIKIDEHSVLIPGTAISGEDREAVTKIFRKYDGSLYRIAVYKNGSVEKQLGKMSEMEIGPIAAEYSSNAKASGLTNWTMKIGNPTHVTAKPTHITGNPTHITGNPTHMTDTGNPTHVPAGRPTHGATIAETSDALVKEVTPILEKYSK
jgi:hypothetical protein